MVLDAEAQKRVQTHLQTSFAQKLVSRAEWDLNDRAELCHLSRNVILNVREALRTSRSAMPQLSRRRPYLEVCDELLHNDLPCREPLYEYVGRTEVVRCDVLPDQALLP